ncbi:hypothetical protein [Morganella morganii]|uniref:hypothetical protein n=1 Tax=Morganella morganii TaxID=582 RepID=UPI00339D2730
MKKSELYQIFEKINAKSGYNGHLNDVVQLFEVFIETVFWLEVQDSKADKLGIGLYESEDGAGPFLDAYITDSNSESPPESLNKSKDNGKITFRKFNGAEILFMRSSIEFNLVVIESKDEFCLITGSMFVAYINYLMKPENSDKNDKIKAILNNSTLLNNGWSATQIITASSGILVMLILLVSILAF